MWFLLFVLFLLCAKLLQSRPTLCDPMDCHPPGSSVHGILQAKILEWVAMPLLQGIFLTAIKPVSPATLALQDDSLLLSHWGSPIWAETYVSHSSLMASHLYFRQLCWQY